MYLNRRASTRLLTKKSCFDAGTASGGSTVKCNQYYSDDTESCKADSDAQAVGNSSSLAPLADDTQYDDSVSWASGLSCSKGPGAACCWLSATVLRKRCEGRDQIAYILCSAGFMYFSNTCRRAVTIALQVSRASHTLL